MGHVMNDAAKLAIKMGTEGADNRILMQPDGSFTNLHSDPPTFTREEIAQHDSGFRVFSYWNQRSDSDERLDLIVEGIDCAARTSRQFTYPMKRTKAKKYPALMVRAGDPRDQTGPPVPEKFTPRYGGWDLDRFTEWATWKASLMASLATKSELATLAGFCYVDGERLGTWTHMYSKTSSSYQPTEAGVRAGATADLATNGQRARYGHDVGGRPTWFAMWWPITNGAQFVCADAATGEARQATISVVAEGGLIAKLVASNQVTVGAWSPAEWQPVWS